LHRLLHFTHQAIQVRTVHESTHEHAVARVENVSACNRERGGGS